MCTVAAIKVDQLADAIAKELNLYSDSVTAAFKKSVDEISKEAAQALNTDSPKRTSRYAKQWTAGDRYESHRTKRVTVYNKKRYQLTHLLEHGHAKRGGGRVPGKAHIAPVEAKAIEKLEKAVREAAQG